MGFVTYPRRWEMFRKASRGMESQKFCVGKDERYEVFFGSATARVEGEGTFARGPNRLDSDCISETDTVLENALGYPERLPKQQKGKPPPEVMKKDAVELPSAWTTYGDTNRPPATVISKGSGLPWKYTVDRHFRVKTVEGTSWKLHEGARGEVAFESAFNWMNDRMYYTAQGAPFCVGHLVAYQQKPPNVYFNYVPQHENSNSNGCWYVAEEAAKNIIQLGCKVKYRIELDYGLHGLVEPDVVKYQMPDWAKENPIINKPPKAPSPGKTSAPRPPPSYVNDGLKCHYRYRPYIMYLDFSIDEPIDTDTHCKNLHDAMSARPGTQLVRVSEDTVTTSRIFAYLLQKKSAKGEESVPAKDAYSLKRMLGVATAMKKRSLVTNGLSCYAETGNLAPFKVQLGLEFYYAFLGDADHVKCLTTPLGGGGWTSTCEKWSMAPVADPTLSHGKLFTSNRKCLSDDTNGGVVLDDADDAMVDCGMFEYDLPGREFTSTQLALTKDDDPRAPMIEKFITGSLYFDNFSKCLARDGRVVPVATGLCWKLRIIYYNFPSQRRALRDQETGSSAGEKAGDVDDAGTGDCAAFDFTDLDDEEPTYD